MYDKIIHGHLVMDQNHGPWLKNTTTRNGCANLPIDGILNDTFGGKFRVPGAG